MKTIDLWSSDDGASNASVMQRWVCISEQQDVQQVMYRDRRALSDKQSVWQD